MWHIDENGNTFKDTGDKLFIKPLYRVISLDKHGNNLGSVTYFSKDDAIEHIQFIVDASNKVEANHDI